MISITIQFTMLSESKITQILTLYESDPDITLSAIAEKSGTHRNSVRRILKEFPNGLNQFRSQPRAVKKGGRRSHWTPQEDRNLKRVIEDNPHLSAKSVMAKIPELSTKSVRTVQRRLQHLGFKSYRAARKPLLTAKMREARIKFAFKYRYWTEKDWSKVSV